ncbi:RNA polymerase sigma factor [Geotalea uraniireducens]|uniref:RNA polymerase sigma factor n=1 Tax=Geotalea uraniireducens TaxID=351604 RepID=A0ABN6VWK9_9BACT|nr:sigma-70 family RNA polymerase sigma factor [Geotalea uraniireducens]BDV42645.1 RNA polymerase sigma factor [Geotalea uraniireducens]
MDFQQAMSWVKENEAIIKGYIAKYRNFSPYEECDYMQEAYESALVAASRYSEKKIKFEAAFWKIFRNQISVITPAPDILTHGSNSIPSHVCCDDLDTVAETRAIESQKEHDIEMIFQSVSHHLTDKEQQALYWALGIGMEGKLSNYEIAERLGCVVSNVRETLIRALDRINSLVERGSIDPKRLFDTKTPSTKEENDEPGAGRTAVSTSTTESSEKNG